MSANTPTEPVRLIVVGDVRLYCEGLAAVLPRERLRVEGTAHSRLEAAGLVHALHPDVVLVDAALPEGLDLIRQLRTDAPAVRPIVFAVGEDITTIVSCAEAGAIAYVPASAGIEELVDAVESAADGELRCSPRVAGELFRRAGEWARSGQRSAEPVDIPVLTSRQRQVLAMLRQCLSNKEIAAALHISEATVKNHVHHLLEKLKVSNRSKAAACLPRPNRAFLKSGPPEPPAPNVSSRRGPDGGTGSAGIGR